MSTSTSTSEPTTQPPQHTPSIPEQPTNPSPEWTRPPDYTVRMARVTASVPFDPATFPSLSRAEQIAYYEATMDAVRREFPDMPIGKEGGRVVPAGQGGGAGGEAGAGAGGKYWVETVVDFGRVVKTLDEGTQKKLNAITSRLFTEVFDEAVVEEVRGEVRGLLQGTYPDVLRVMEEVLFERKEGWGKVREYILKEVEAGRGNPFLKCAVPGRGEGVERGEGEVKEVD